MHRLFIFSNLPNFLLSHVAMAAVGLQKNIYMKKHIRKQDDATYQDLEQCGANEAQHRLDMTPATYRAQKGAASWRRKGFSYIHIHLAEVSLTGTPYPSCCDTTCTFMFSTWCSYLLMCHSQILSPEMRNYQHPRTK